MITVQSRLILVTREDGSYVLELPITGSDAKTLFDRLRSMQDAANGLALRGLFGAL